MWERSVRLKNLAGKKKPSQKCKARSKLKQIINKKVGKSKNKPGKSKEITRVQIRASGNLQVYQKSGLSASDIEKQPGNEKPDVR